MKRHKLVTCTTPSCNRNARHWVCFDEKRPQRRKPICHKCFKLNETAIHFLNKTS